MPKVDLDFQKYVERRRGALKAQAREGAAYAYAGDLRILRTLDRLRPVRMAVETSVRLWSGRARTDLLGDAPRLSPRSDEALNALFLQAAERLHVTPPQAFLLTSLPEAATLTLGSAADPTLLIDRARMAGLGEEERIHIIGRELGRAQNGHVPFATARYYLTHDVSRFLRWVVTPATRALDAWARRAEVTCDRAGLLCTRNVDASESAIRKSAPDDNAAERRVQALRLFAESAYFRGVVGGEGGLTLAECDAKVAELR
jgi:hypothetical protein